MRQESTVASLHSSIQVSPSFCEWSIRYHTPLHPNYPMQGQIFIPISLFQDSIPSAPVTLSSCHTTPQFGRSSSSGSLTRVCHRTHRYGQLGGEHSNKGLPCKVTGIGKVSKDRNTSFASLRILGYRVMTSPASNANTCSSTSPTNVESSEPVSS